jgi:hypothetical protein
MPIRSLPVSAIHHWNVPCRSLPALPCHDPPNASKTEPADPCLPCRSASLRAVTRTAETNPDLPALPFSAPTVQASPGQSVASLPCPAEPFNADDVLNTALPCLPCHAQPKVSAHSLTAQLRLPCFATPGHSRPDRDEPCSDGPCLPCLADPDRKLTGRSKLNSACLASPSRA